MMKRLNYWLLMLLGCASCAPAPKAPHEEHWVAYYDSKLPSRDFAHYDLVVFDRRYHPDIKPLEGKVTLLAYISIGEAHGDEPQLKKLRAEDAILSDNKQWDSHVMNLTSSRWQRLVRAQVADALHQGFDGVMLDTVDSALDAAWKRSPECGEANRQAAIAMITELHRIHPGMKIMLNRGLGILPDVSQQLDFMLAESILAETNVSTGQSRLFSPNSYRQVVALLKDAQRQSPQLKIHTLDYWDPDDVQGIREIYARQREQGFIPYVATPDLRRLLSEPHSTQTPRQATGLPLEDGEHDA